MFTSFNQNLKAEESENFRKNSLKKLQNEHFVVYESHFVIALSKKIARRTGFIWIKLEADKCHAQQEDFWFEWKARRKTWNIIIAEAKCEIYGNFTNCYTSFATFSCLIFRAFRVLLIIQEERDACLVKKKLYSSYKCDFDDLLGVENERRVFFLSFLHLVRLFEQFLKFSIFFQNAFLVA